MNQSIDLQMDLPRMTSRQASIVILFFVLITSSCQSIDMSNDVILDESFNDNGMGWVEENTSSHYLEIVDGYYRIRSKDTTSQRTSSGSLAGKYLLDLPQKYYIESSMKLIESENDETHYGIILLSASLEYNFSIYSSGWVLFTEYDYNLDSVQTIGSKYLELDPDDFSKIKIDIDQRKFKLKVDDIEVGSGEFKTGTSNWHDLRLYTSKSSSTAVDYLRMKS